MLSILIPVHNCRCTDFVAALSAQADALSVPCEIIVGDDASDDAAARAANRAINRLPHARLIERSENRGRAYMRNFLAEQARYDHLLWLDSDLMPADDRFLARYVEAADGRSVVCGTIVFRPPAGIDPRSSLRYVYARAREEHTAQERARAPYASFAAFSCMAPRAVFEQVRFCDEITTYGHEDTLFGKELQAAGVPVRYIDNPVVHPVADTNAGYLRKTESTLVNALRYRDRLRGCVRILGVQERLRRLGLQPLVRLLFALFRRPLRRNLLGSRPRLRLLDLYKLGFICTLDRRMNS